jgi:DNA-binding GntR family transcriptional regulator
MERISARDIGYRLLAPIFVSLLAPLPNAGTVSALREFMARPAARTSELRHGRTIKKLYGMNDLTDNETPVTQYRTRDLAARIERDIVSGRLSGGAWLKQIDLEEKYGSTRLDIRQALERLAERGMVELVARRGYRVKEVDAARLRNILKVRAVLEVAAAEEVMSRIDEAGFARLEELAQAFETAVKSGTVAEQEETNRAFHVEMLKYCENRELVQMIFDLRSRIPVAITRERNTATLLAQAAQDHFTIIALMRAGDLAGLTSLMRRHVTASFNEPAAAG